MTSFNNRIKMPFAMSLALIFSYSLLQVMVPTDPDTTDAAVATLPDTELRTALLDEQIVITNSANALINEPDAKVH